MDEYSSKSRLHVLRDMVLFVEVGRKENFTSAAKSLGIPLSTLARRISHLEKALGMLLVERTTRQQRLTLDGLRYFERCQHVVDDALAAYDDVHSISRGLGGTIRVAAPLEVLGKFMAASIAAFLQQHDGVNVLVDDARASTVPGPSCDLIVRIGQADEQWLVASKAGNVPLSLYAAPSYLAAHPPIDSRKRLRDHTLLVPHDLLPHCGAILRDFESTQVNLKGRLASDTFQPLATFASLGYGLVLLPKEIAAPYIMDGSLTSVLSGWTTATLPIFMVTSTKLVPARLRLFVSFLTKRFWAEFNPRDEAA